MTSINRAKTMVPFTGQQLQDYTGKSVQDLRSDADKVGASARAALEMALRNPQMVNVQGGEGYDEKGKRINGSMQPRYADEGDKYGVLNLFKSPDPAKTAVHELNHMGHWLQGQRGEEGNTRFEDNTENSTRERMMKAMNERNNEEVLPLHMRQMFAAGGTGVPTPYLPHTSKQIGEYQGAVDYTKEMDNKSRIELSQRYGINPNVLGMFNK